MDFGNDAPFVFEEHYDERNRQTLWSLTDGPTGSTVTNSLWYEYNDDDV